MMISEFHQLTGFYPTAELYEAIEAAYGVSSMSKEDFCEAYRTNRDGMAERIAFNIDWDKCMTTLQLEAAAKKHIEGLEAEVERLRGELEREQEWKDYEFESRMSQYAYEELTQSQIGKEIGDEVAADSVASEFGFDREKVVIRHTIQKNQINRHGVLRSAGVIARNPYWASTDWNYIAFTVSGIDWEMVDGDLWRS